MLDQFLDTALAQVDDVYELKVTLVALRLLDRKQSGTASLTLRELEAQPVLQESFGRLLKPRLEFALQSAVARGTLLRTAALNEDDPRYFANTPAGRGAVEAIESTLQRAEQGVRTAQTTLAEARPRVYAEVARLECVDVYRASPSDDDLLEEWLGRGYSADEVIDAVRGALHHPRVKGSPPRGLAQCAKAVESKLPAVPSDYYRIVVCNESASFALNDLLVHFNAKWRRRTNAREFALLQTALGMFGHAAALDGLMRVARTQDHDLSALLPLLAESEEAALEASRKGVPATNDALLAELVQLYESSLGLPPTGFIMDEMRAMAQEHKDPEVWRAAFQYAVAQNKRGWGFVRYLVQNRPQDMYLPDPVNDTARAAFDEYRRRIGRGTLDASVAREINAVAERVTDSARWTDAFDKAAKANALNWNYIKAILSDDKRPKSGATHGSQKAGPGQSKRTTRRPQVQYTDEDRRAAEERARRQLAEREKQRSGGQG